MLRYFGPPGTGKTTTLLNQVEKFMSEGVSPNDIGYFAFTRKASNVARDRAVARFKLDPDEDFTYFRTLHSLAFLLMGYNSSEILKESHLREFSEKVGVDLTTGSGKIEDEGFIMFRSNHPVMRCMDLARSTLQGPEAAYRISNLFIAFYEFNHIFEEYEKFKKYNGLKDFTDMLVDLSENPSYIPLFKVVFLDEAQDLTPLQWKIAHFINENTDRMFIAGDDDQGIYRWAGADINHFIGLEGGSEVLAQSHRIPRSVYRVADSITRRIKKRQKKDWSPRPEEGTVSRTYDFWGIEFEEEEWLVLAQANYMLDEVAHHLKSSGQFFERYGNPSLSKKIRTAISSWDYLNSGTSREITHREALNLYDHISASDGQLERGAKKLLKSADENDFFSLYALRESFGLEAEGSWDVALDKIRDEDRAYATALVNRGVDLNSKPTIKLSTIHGANRGESDNVLLYLDLTGKALEEMSRNPDDAYRVLYVGVTRTKQNLVLKLPEDSQRGWLI